MNEATSSTTQANESQAKLLEAQELDRLFRRSSQDPVAREALVIRFKPLAEYLARRFVRRGEPLDDLTQVAMVGLLNAIDRFDPDRGVQFGTYAGATIVGELRRHFRDKGWAVHVPRRLQEIALRLNQALPELSQRLGRSPTIADLAAYMEVTEEDVIEAMDAAQAYSTGSLDEPVGEQDVTLKDTLGSEDASLELLDTWASVAPTVKTLPARDRKVLYLRFFSGLTQSEIAAEIGVSQMHVSRILSQTLETLRKAAGEGAGLD